VHSMGIYKTSTKGMTREEWLAERRKGIGGSDAAAIVGLNDYVTPFALWADKTGKLPEKPDSEAMRQGRDLEEYVAHRWCEATGKRVKRDTHIIRNTMYPFAHANIDRWVNRENAGLECKTTSIMNLKKFKDGNYPATYYTQCVHYMAVTGAKRWYLAVLVLNQGFYEFTIERDEDEIRTLMQLEKEFWGSVVSGTPPPVDGKPVTTDALTALYKGGDDEGVELFGRDGAIQNYMKWKKEIELMKCELEGLKQLIMQDMGDHEKGYTGKYTVSWKPQTRTSYDMALLAKENPGLDLSKYAKATASRPFIIKEIKAKENKENG